MVMVAQCMTKSLHKHTSTVTSTYSSSNKERQSTKQHDTHKAKHYVTKVTLQSVALLVTCGGLQGGQIFCTHFAIKNPFPCFFIFLLTFLETFAPSRLGAKLPLRRLQHGFIIETGCQSVITRTRAFCSSR